MTEEFDLNTSVKIITIFSSDSGEICLVCCLNAEEKYKNPSDFKVRLWDQTGAKTKASKVVENVLREVLADTDFRIIFRTCYGSIQNLSKELEKKHKQFGHGRTFSKNHNLQQVKGCRREDDYLTANSPHCQIPASPKAKASVSSRQKRVRLHFNRENVIKLNQTQNKLASIDDSNKENDAPLRDFASLDLDIDHTNIRETIKVREQ